MYMFVVRYIKICVYSGEKKMVIVIMMSDDLIL